MRNTITTYVKMLFMLFLLLFVMNTVFAAKESRPSPVEVEKVLKKLDDFFVLKRKNDKLSIAKEEKIRDIMPMVMRNSPVSEWMDYFSLYYDALGELHKAGMLITPEFKKILDPDPDELLGKYIDDERKIAADNLTKSDEEKNRVLKERIDNLVKAKESGTIKIDEMTGRMYTAAFVYAPSETRLLKLMRERVMLSSQLRQGEMNIDAYDKVWKEMTEKYMAGNKDNKQIQP